MKTILCLLGLLAGGWAVFTIVSQQSSPSDTVTVCQASCDSMDDDFRECTMKGGKLSPIADRRFKVNIADQTVFEEEEFTGPYKFNSCKIMYLDNWSCPYNDNSGEIGMGRGKFYEHYSEQYANSRWAKAKGQVPCSANTGCTLRDTIEALWPWRNLSLLWGAPKPPDG
jgi:hypothetical protein